MRTIAGPMRCARPGAVRGGNPRRLRTRFHSYVGVTPKRAARLWRFQHASQLIADAPISRWLRWSRRATSSIRLI
jgi:methylphosphotriester-DNA--protein-cysteine methyltransferase